MNKIYQFPFLGNRQYLHGTTLFDSLRTLVPKGASVHFKISEMIESDCVEITDSEKDVRPNAVLYWKSATNEGRISIYAQLASKEIQRQEYDEQSIDKQVIISEKEAVFSGISPYSFIATIIPIHKKLLKNCIQPEQPGQWFFTRLVLDTIPESFQHVTLKFIAVIGKQLAKSEIAVDGGRIGEMYFSWKRAE
ncbi:MAG TPA: hypothetical protein VEC36_08320 [Patescibacteria group bacterium]|nr:hypothetical protein [Patescibacteria group bacterium]